MDDTDRDGRVSGNRREIRRSPQMIIPRVSVGFMQCKRDKPISGKFKFTKYFDDPERVNRNDNFYANVSERRTEPFPEGLNPCLLTYHQSLPGNCSVNIL